ncbi:universal stress protein [Nocardioides sp. TF02-7]|uniref:universal stress protein n=1 Tax=Nocardioides sp. TF02-7 TaxID=2917724 RepID=UPI001F05A6EE|nr:universal stress protein [Nocardioides sp. TF02-7]UMG91893.1 universal stress protein [Nocardioides sp. TF02-7]
MRGEPRGVLTDLAAHAHLLVLGSRGRGAVLSRLLGSVSASVGKHASCPVVVVRPGHRRATDHGVLVGADGTLQSLPVIEFAFRQASLHDQPLTVLHCVWDLAAAVDGPSLLRDGQPEARALLSESVAGFRERYPEVRVDLQVARGFAETCLAADSDRWSLIVVGRHPAESLGRLATPTVATSVLERARTCVAVVPQEP